MRTPAAHPDRLTAEERRELDDDAFGIPSRREFPLVDAAHVRAAESYFRSILTHIQQSISSHKPLQHASSYGFSK